ncbi:MAG: chromate transporter, partial [Rhodospirillales bacterium]|nr:chromate transporter [Rhodospirillales bacterium]
TAPSSILTFVSAHLWHKFRDRPWRRAIQAGLMPVTGGLVMAGAVLLAHSTSIDWRAAVLTLVATGLFLSDRLHPMLVLAAAAVVGAFGLVG